MFLIDATLLVAAERRLDRDQRLDLVGPRLERLEAEGAGLAVHQHDARADLVDQLDIGGDDLLVGGEPARHALLHELLVGLDRKLRARIGRALALSAFHEPIGPTRKRSHGSPSGSATGSPWKVGVQPERPRSTASEM